MTPVRDAVRAFRAQRAHGESLLSVVGAFISASAGADARSSLSSGVIHAIDQV
jgi:hypothetical protein